MVEHVAAGKEEDGDEAQGSPDVATLHNEYDIWPGNIANGDTSGDKSDDSKPLHPVERTLDCRVWAIWSMASNPLVNLLCGLCSIGEVVTERLGGGAGVRTGGGIEEEENGGSLEAEL